MASQLLSLAGWSVLPGLASRYIQPTLYTIFIRAGDPHPAPGSPRHNSDRKKILIAVILLYLAYSVYEAEYQLRAAGDLYSFLGVPLDIDTKDLQRRKRRIAAQFHPDKVSSADASANYVNIQAAYDVLLNPVMKYAYDRFGPDVLLESKIRNSSDSKMIRDYVMTAMYHISGYYFFSILTLMVISWAGYMKYGGVFWRYYVMVALFVLEVANATRPDFLSGLRWFNALKGITGREYLPFQAIAMLRKLSVTLFIALSQLGPLFSKEGEQTLEAGEKGMLAQIGRIEMIAKAAEAQVGGLIALELRPFGGSEDDFKQLKGGVKEWLKGNTIRNDKEVVGAIQQVLARRREAEGGVSAN